MDELSFGTTVAIDGFQGYVIIEPSDLQLEDFNKKRSQWLNHAQEEIKLAELEARTRDGHLIHLMANIGSPSDIDTALKADIEGIGLYRTELYFLHRNRLVSEEEQLADYKKMAQKLGNRIFTIRTLDLGGDKFFADDGKYYRELNPYLGRRAIRISLQELDVFKAQLRAIYRASTVGNIQIMFPMVSNLEEVIQIKQILYDVRKELTDGGYAYNPKVPIGIMIEIPSAALIIDSLISHVDFVSVGTNDLIQYTLAVDRSNERISYLYEPLNPAILQLLEKVSLSARRHNKKASICGEMAGDPLYTELLLGMGYETLSISSYFIPQIKSRIREIDTVQAIETAKKSITMNSCRKIKKLLQKNLDLAIKN